MYGSDVDSIKVNLEFFQSGEILSVPLLQITPKQDEKETESENERLAGPNWELAK